MKFSEKIIELRKANGMTQEELATICNVSRQSISKWEADIALPETEKLLILGDTFRVSMDILLKDDDNRRAIIIEAKKSSHESDMETDCEEALDQIVQKKYAQGLYGYKQIVCYGVAFFQKQAMIKCYK